MWLHICKEVWGPDSIECMHMISKTSPKIPPFWYPDQSLRLVWLLEPSSKCVLFWFFSIKLLKKQTLNPEITILYQFHDKKKTCLKFPKSATLIFGLKMNPHPLSENSCDLVAGPCPYLIVLLQHRPLHLAGEDEVDVCRRSRGSSAVVLRQLPLHCVPPGG